MVFSISAKTATAIIALLSATVNGHIVMTSPKPFTFPNESTKQSPLDPSGADFPCKFPAGFTPERFEDPDNTFAPGSGGNLATIGGATHGGGSCQVSITTDTVPTKNSVWKVIKSIEGGCPSDAPGNLGESATTPNPTTFPFTIPADTAPGEYTLAWTWFNKLGNEEAYMNCGPIRITAGAAKREVAKISKKRQSALPDMFMANIGNGCTTPRNADVTFPDPGADLQVGSKVVPGAPVGNCGAVGATPPSGTGNNATSGEEAPESPAPESPAAESPAPAPQPSASAPATAPQPPATAPQSSAAAPVPAPPGGAVAGGARGSPCSPVGSFTCAADGNSFTICEESGVSESLKMSVGEKCIPGTDPTNLNRVVVKRSVRFGAEHLARLSEDLMREV